MIGNPEVHVVRDNICLSYPQIPPYHPDSEYAEYPFRKGKIGGENKVYGMVRRLFHQMGLDVENYDDPSWNPLGCLIRPGNTVLLKPNFVSHYNWGYRKGLVDTDSLVTHGSVIRAVLDYVVIALKGTGRIVVGDAPLQSADFEELVKLAGLDEIRDFYDLNDLKIDIVDFRLKQAIVNQKNQLIRQVDLTGSQNGYVVVNLRKDSLLDDISSDYRKFRVAAYDFREMKKHHNREKHEYIIPKIVFESDVVINLPKLKSHVKAGITASLKNLVGINAHKDWLPHHRRGPVVHGGDEYRDYSLLKKSWLLIQEMEWQTKKTLLRKIYREMARLPAFISRNISDDGIYQGGWYGNDTLWRTILDINRAFFYSNKKGQLQNTIQRKYLSVIDGIIGGEGESPLSPSPKPCGLLIGGFNPVATDTVAATLMGFDYKKIPTIVNAFKTDQYPLCSFDPDDIVVSRNSQPTSLSQLRELQTLSPFKPGKGWFGHIEDTR